MIHRQEKQEAKWSVNVWVHQKQTPHNAFTQSVPCPLLFLLSNFKVHLTCDPIYNYNIAHQEAKHCKGCISLFSSKWRKKASTWHCIVFNSLDPADIIRANCYGSEFKTAFYSDPSWQQ